MDMNLKYVMIDSIAQSHFILTLHQNTEIENS